MAFALPNDDGLTLVVYCAHRERLAEFRRDREAGFLAAVRALPGAPAIDQEERVGPLMGQLEIPNVRHAAAASGIALVGNAALTTDPVPGVAARGRSS